jgi:hypothetical protein
MDFINRSPPISPHAASLDQVEEWLITTNGGVITKIESIDRATQQRTDVSVHAGLSSGSGDADQTEQSVVNTKNQFITKIEKIDRATQRRTELSREEYAGLVAAMGLGAYYAGIRDYAVALVTGDTNTAQTYYKAMTDYFAGMGQS